MAENPESTKDVQEIITDKLEATKEEGETLIDDKFINKWGVGVAVFSFGFLCIGSFLFGATATTAVLRGFGGAVLFGALFWLVGTMLTQEETAVNKVKTQDKSTEEEQ